MNSAGWLTFFQLIFNSSNQIDQLNRERQASHECIIAKECISIYNEEIQSWVIYSKENLKRLSCEDLTIKRPMSEKKICHDYLELEKKEKAQNSIAKKTN